MSLTMAGVLALSMAAPALADDDPVSSDNTSTPSSSDSTQDTNTTIVISTDYKKITIAVTVPTTGTAQINPYGLPVELTLSDNSTKKITGQQITSQPMYITNDGDIALTVGATASIKANDGTNIVTKANSKSTTKDVLAQLQMVASKATDLEASTETGAMADTSKDKLITEFATASTWTDSGVTSLTLSTSETTNSSMGTLAASTIDTTNKKIKYAAGSVALFRLTGSVTESPTEAWATTDGFTTTVAFTFKPVSST
jgi:hypothetical protein